MTRKNLTIFFLFAIIGSTILFVVKGLMITDISLSDECHQIATAYRFWQGDSPLVDDWSSEQLHGLVLLPVLSPFLAFTKSTEGVVLYLRMVYLLLKFVVAIWAFYKLKNKNNIMNILFGILLWYFFSPYNIDTLTYQAMPLIMLMIAVVILYAEEPKPWECIVFGAVYALSVLSQPFWIISYIPILVFLFFKRTTMKKFLLFFHIGIGTIFILFCAVVLINSSVMEIIDNIIFIIEEQDHDLSGLGLYGILYQKVWLVFITLIRENKFVSVINLLYICILACVKPYRERLKIGMPICLSLSIISMFFLKKPFLMNEFFIPFIWMGVENMLFVLKKCKYMQLFFLGILFSIAVALGTNTGKLATSASLCILAVIVLFFGDYEGLSKKEKNFNNCLMFTVLLLGLGLRIIITWGGVITPACYEYRICDGPMKGMFASVGLYNQYYEIWDDVQSMNLDTQDILFCGTSTPLAYLDAEVEFGTMGTPFFKLNYKRYEDYLLLHPEKHPTIVYFYEIADDDRNNLFFSRLIELNDIEYRGKRLIIRMRRDRSISLHSNMSIMK